MKKGLLQFLKAVTFCLLCLGIFLLIEPVFQASNEFSEHAEMMIRGYYAEPEDSADVVFLGNSHVYRFWQSAFAWKERGLAATAWSTSNMPPSCAVGITEEIQKTQSPKVLCVDASMFSKKAEESASKVYLILPYMKASKTKYGMIRDFCRVNGYSKKEALPYYLPFLQFHSRWDELKKGDFIQTQVSYLNSCYQQEFLEKTAQGKVHRTTEKRKKIDKTTEEVLRDYLTYCQGLDCEVVFYIAPLWGKSTRCKRLNYISDLIQEYGFRVINYNDEELYNSLGLDETTDIQDGNHTNIRGSYKFTKVLADTLIQDYDLPDRRNDPAYAQRDAKADAYYEIIEPYLATGK